MQPFANEDFKYTFVIADWLEDWQVREAKLVYYRLHCTFHKEGFKDSKGVFILMDRGKKQEW